nr:hypothetical protein [Tanacetum cinerariifolium]
MVMSGSQRSKEEDVQKISTSVFVTNFPDGTEAGKRFGFVRFIKVFDIDRLINNLRMVNNKGTNDVNHGAKGMTNSYTYVVKGNQVENVGMEECPNMVLDETCLKIFRGYEDFSWVKKDMRILGSSIWEVLGLCLCFKMIKPRKGFNLILAVGSWFSQIIQAHNDFVIDERVVWVEVEGIPCKWWSRNTFSRTASRWGTLLNGEESEEKGYHSNRIYIRTKLKTVIFDSFKMVYRGMTCWVRAIEVPENLKDVEGESDREEVPETNFEEVPDKSMFEGNSVRQNDVHSEDLLVFMRFTPNEEGDVPVEKVDNWSDESRVNDGRKM